MNICLANHSLDTILLNLPIVPIDPMIPPKPNDIIDSIATIDPCPNIDVKDGFLSFRNSSMIYPVAPAVKEMPVDIANDVNAADADAVVALAITAPS